MLLSETLNRIGLLDIAATVAYSYSQIAQEDTTDALSKAIDSALPLFKDYDEALERRLQSQC